MSLSIYFRAPRVEGQKNRPYVAIEEKRGFKTSGYSAPFYVRRNGGWHRLSAQAFADAQIERNSIENGKTAVATNGRVTLKTAVEHFLEMKKRKNDSTVQNYTYNLNEFLTKTSARFVDEFSDQIQFLLGHISVQTTEKYLGCKQRLREAVNDRIGIEPR